MKKMYEDLVIKYSGGSGGGVNIMKANERVSYVVTGGVGGGGVITGGGSVVDVGGSHRPSVIQMGYQ